MCGWKVCAVVCTHRVWAICAALCLCPTTPKWKECQLTISFTGSHMAIVSSTEGADAISKIFFCRARLKLTWGYLGGWVDRFWKSPPVEVLFSVIPVLSPLPLTSDVDAKGCGWVQPGHVKPRVGVKDAETCKSKVGLETPFQNTENVFRHKSNSALWCCRQLWGPRNVHHTASCRRCSGGTGSSASAGHSASLGDQRTPVCVHSAQIERMEPGVHTASHNMRQFCSGFTAGVLLFYRNTSWREIPPGPK